jgi:hypothetical protein
MTSQQMERMRTWAYVGMALFCSAFWLAIVIALVEVGR